MISTKESQVFVEIPAWVTVYDNGGSSIDRYTAVFTTPELIEGYGDLYSYISMSGNPTHPQGFYQHGEFYRRIDQPTSDHLGTKIEFANLPEVCQILLIEEYSSMYKK